MTSGEKVFRLQRRDLHTSKKEPESEKIWKVLSLSFLQKYEEEHSRDNIKGTAKQSLDEEMWT